MYFSHRIARYKLIGDKQHKLVLSRIGEVFDRNDFQEDIKGLRTKWKLKLHKTSTQEFLNLYYGAGTSKRKVRFVNDVGRILTKYQLDINWIDVFAEYVSTNFYTAVNDPFAPIFTSYQSTYEEDGHEPYFSNSKYNLELFTETTFKEIKSFVLPFLSKNIRTNKTRKRIRPNDTRDHLINSLKEKGASNREIINEVHKKIGANKNMDKPYINTINSRVKNRKGTK